MYQIEVIINRIVSKQDREFVEDILHLNKTTVGSVEHFEEIIDF